MPADTHRNVDLAYAGKDLAMKTIHLSDAQVACLLDILERAEARYVEDSEDRHAIASVRAKASVDAATVSRMFTLIQNQTREANDSAEMGRIARARGLAGNEPEDPACPTCGGSMIDGICVSGCDDL